jgi:DNA-binding helix-hairpin-helix protein with protein kinase domain
LLFMGRHPFAGRYLCKGEMPIERAIAECRFAYSHDSARTKMSPPPLTLPLAAATLSIAECFERAFHPDGRRGGRPTPEDWVRTVDALKASLTDCTSVAWHQYPPGLRACPWCEIERASGAKLYGGVIRVASAAITDVQGLWGPPFGVSKGPGRTAA